MPKKIHLSLLIILLTLLLSCGKANPKVTRLKDIKHPSYQDVTNTDRPVSGNWDFSPATQWFIQSISDRPIMSLAELACDDEGNIYLLDIRQYRIHKLDPQGKALKSFGSKGSGPGEFNMPRSLFVVDKSIFIVDQGNRLHRFDRNGQYLDTYKYGNDRSPDMMLNTDSYVCFRENLEQKQKTVDLEIYTLSTNQSLKIAELPPDTHLILQLGSGRGSSTTYISIPEITAQQIYCRGRDHFFYGRTDEYAIRRVRFSGQEDLKFSIVARRPLRVSDEVKQEMTADMIQHIPMNLDPKQIKKSIPDNYVLFDHIQTDQNGFCYVFVCNQNNRSEKIVDIFSPQGEYRYRGRFVLPDAKQFKNPVVIHGHCAYIATEDDQGNYGLMKLRIKLPATKGH